MAIKQEYKCEVCEKEFRTESKLKRHVLSGHKLITKTETAEEKQNACHTCGMQFEKMKYLIKHISKFHEEKKPSPKHETIG